MPFNQVHRMRRGGVVTSQMCLNMAVLTADGCYGDVFNIFLSNTTLESSPIIDGLQEAFTINVDTNFKTISACLNSTFLSTLRGNEPINLVFGVHWQSDILLDTTKVSYINAVYELIVIDTIQTQLIASTLNVDLEQTVVLDASGSAYQETGLKHGLYFKWKCPAVF